MFNSSQCCGAGLLFTINKVPNRRLLYRRIEIGQILRTNECIALDVNLAVITRDKY